MNGTGAVIALLVIGTWACIAPALLVMWVLVNAPPPATIAIVGSVLAGIVCGLVDPNRGDPGDP